MPVPKFHAPTAIDSVRDSLQAYLEESVSNGVEFLPEQTIQFGWSILKVAGTPAEPFLTAPTLGKMPMEFGRDCSDVLMTTLRQRYICDSFQTELSECSAIQSAIVIRDFHKCGDRFMDRLDPESDNSSGWYFGAYDNALDPNDPDNLELKSLWEIACAVPVSREFMFLPTGWQVMLDDGPSVLRDHEIADVVPGSYFSAKYLQN